MMSAPRGGGVWQAGSTGPLSIEIPRQHQPRVDMDIGEGNNSRGAVADKGGLGIGVPALSTMHGGSSPRREPGGKRPTDGFGWRSEPRDQQVRRHKPVPLLLYDRLSASRRYQKRERATTLQ